MRPASGQRQKPDPRIVRVGAIFALAMIAGAVVTPAPPPRSPSGYADDTHLSLAEAGKVVTLRGDQGMERFDFKAPGRSRVALDAREARFTVANSRNPHPTADQPCERGALPTNPYPLRLLEHDRGMLAGGLILSRVPQGSEWRASYCNSAAVYFRDVANGIVDGVRITGAWDAVRASKSSPNLLITNSWISNVKDDAFENDYLQPAVIRDTLIDGAFEGISIKPSSKSSIGDSSSQVVTMSGVLLLLREYPYKGKMLFGALAKSEARSPRLRVRNSIIAVDYDGGGTYPHFWTTSWAKTTDSSNNLFLWLSDTTIPPSVALPPGSFKVLQGQSARDAWARAKSNWINCHPKLARLPSDPRSDPAACRAGTWGGYTN